jgi:hypothetical protein
MSVSDDVSRRLADALRANETLWECLHRAATLNLPAWYLGAGCGAQTIWNLAHGKAPSAISCLEGELKGDPNNIRLAPTVIKLVGETTDPLGEWLVDVEVEDVLRNTKLPLRTRFTLLSSG